MSVERRWSHDPTPDYPEKILAALTESGYAVIESNLVVGERGALDRVRALADE